MNEKTTATSTASAPFQFPAIQPFDENNQALLRNVHPPDWVNPEPAERYNMVVIGAGTAGLVTAAGAAGLGAKVALIERELMGGDCLNVGCVPSKALIRCAHAIADVRHAHGFGMYVPEVATVDFPAIMQRMRRLRATISRNDSAERFRDLGIDVFLGRASFTGNDTVQVDGKTLRFAKACIATGACAADLPIPGLAEVGYLTNETVFSLMELPKRLAVIGAGPIGCELSQAFAHFGSEVYLIETVHGVLPQEDRDAAQVFEHAIGGDGVKLLCCARNLTFSKDANGKRLSVRSHDAQADLVVDEILSSVGRAPNVENLGLGAAGIAFDKMGVKVNDYLQTTNSRVYAAGDICSKYKFTHSADALARIVIQNALFFGRGKVSALTIPWCTYTSPEIAHVGLYEQSAKEKGIPIKTIKVELAGVDRAILDGEDEGFLKVHYTGRKGTILGATIVARHAGEMISEITLAMVAGAGLGTIARTIHPYPTQAEAIKRAGDAYNRTRLTPRVRKLFEHVMIWRR